MTDEYAIISIPNAEFIQHLPFDPFLNQESVFLLLLSAVAQRATKIHFEPKESLSRIWFTINGEDWEFVPVFKEDVERVIISSQRSKWLRRKKSTGLIPVLLEIGSKTVELLACINPPALDIYVIDTKGVYNEARAILDCIPVWD